LTFGSDAHNPDHVGMDFGHAIHLIKKYGNGRISVFDRRQRTEVEVG